MERYVFSTDKEEMEEIFGVIPGSKSILNPTYNAAPGNSLPILYKIDGRTVLENSIWGMDELGSAIDIDELLENKKYRDLLVTNACLVPINGFYIWKKTVSDPLPFYTRIHTRKLLGIAGIYSEHEGQRNTFTVITKAANVLIKPVTNTMPCIIDPDDFQIWFDGQAASILTEGFNDVNLLPEVTVVRVPDLVNDLANNSPDLIQPIPKLREED
ncbi:MAG: hypothetical protein ED557_11320 [Balneola sp.]|nr:MAG: hypothetical protein ED557_11320 [Balneola sp.]